MQKVRRKPLREEIKEMVVDHLLSGRLQADRSVRETAMADALGVSRTPLREALIDLEREGLLESRMGRGFVLRPLQPDEAREVYPIVWTLEAMAVRAARLDDALLKDLESANQRLSRCRAGRRRVALDLEWHTRLTRAAGNSRLQDVLGSLKLSIARYEVAFMHSEEREVGSSIAEHAEVIARLRHGDRAAAARLVERHWRRGMRVLLERMAEDGTHEKTN